MNIFKAALIGLGLNSFLLFGADFFPLQDGNTWTYREHVSGVTFTMRVSDPVAINDHVYYKLTGYTTSDLLVRVEEVYGALMYWDAGLNQEVLLTSFEQFEGGHWIAPYRPCPEEDGQTQLKRGTHDGPAGPLSDVLQIRYRAISCADIPPIDEQYAEHLGMLRRTVNTIAGPYNFDLISAKVGSITIDAAPNGSFSVSVGPTTGAGAVATTFRLRVNSPSPLTLSFSSGQEYDFTLRDSDGNSLWTWSADKTFLQSVHQRTVKDEWSVTVDMPFPRLPDGSPRPGSYTVEAVVTTAGSSPFAATAPLAIPAPQQP